MPKLDLEQNYFIWHVKKRVKCTTGRGKSEKKSEFGSPWSGFPRLKGGTPIMFGPSWQFANQFFISKNFISVRLLHVNFIIETTIQECYLNIQMGGEELKQTKIDVKTSTFLQFLLHLSMQCHFNGMWIMENRAYWIIWILKNLKWIKQNSNIKV
jgi:hypothetical protein